MITIKIMLSISHFNKISFDNPAAQTDNQRQPLKQSNIILYK